MPTSSAVPKRTCVTELLAAIFFSWNFRGDWLRLPQYRVGAGYGAIDPKKDKRSAIMIFNLGAPSQLDTFDMKPDAPAEIRGPFKPISTKVDGISISEILPMHAKIADKFSQVLSCFHRGAAVQRFGMANHANGQAVPRWSEYSARRIGSQLSSRSTYRFTAACRTARNDGTRCGNLPNGQAGGITR